MKQKCTHASELDGTLYLIDTVSRFPTIRITSYEVKLGKKKEASFDEDDVLDSDERPIRVLGTKEVKLSFDKIVTCEPVAPYFVCTNGKQVSVVNLAQGSVLDVTTNEEVSEISGTSSNELSAVALKGNGFVKIFRITHGPG